MRFIIGFLAVIILFGSHTQAQVPTERFVEFWNKDIKKREGSIRNNKEMGRWTYWDISGKMLKTINWWNGAKQGISEFYYGTGIKAGQLNYAKDVLSGDCYYWYENGVPKQFGAYKNGQKYGQWVTWDNLGNKRKEEFFYSNDSAKIIAAWDERRKEIKPSAEGKYTDVYKCEILDLSKFEQLKSGSEITSILPNYYQTTTENWPNNKKLREGLMNAGKEVGRWNFFNNSEVLVQQVDYANGVVDGLIITYFSNGRRETECQYTQTIKQGYSYSWHDNGFPKEFGWFKNDKKDSVWITWDAYGDKKSELMYFDSISSGMINYWDEAGKQIVGQGNGAFIDYYSNKNIRQQGNYKNMREDGEWKSFYDNGQVFSKGGYKEGQKIGAWQSWYKEGALKSELNYDNGKNTFWLSNGQKEMEGFVKNGLKHGHWTFWYANGQKEHEGEYDTDKRTGLHTWYYEDGTVKTEMTFIADKMNGVAKWYFADAKLDMEGNFLDDKQHGKWTYWRKNGEKGNEGFYENGLMHGHWTYWYGFDKIWTQGNNVLISYGNDTVVKPAGYRIKENAVWKEGDYKNGKRNGIWTTYYENGVKFHEGELVDGKESGKWISWYENEKKMREGFFKDGLMTGKWMEWYENGQKKYDLYYANVFTLNEESFAQLKATVPHDIMNLLEAIKNKAYSGKDELRKSLTTLLGDATAQKHINDLLLRAAYISVKDSVASYWFENGKIELVEHFRNGLRNGLRSTFNEKGTPVSQGSYANDLRHGTWVYYNELGRKVREENYKNGQKDGLWFEWSDRGQLLGEQLYKDDVKHGRWVMYAPDGKIQKETNYKDGFKHGAERTYGPNGNVTLQTNYVNGRLEVKQ